MSRHAIGVAWASDANDTHAMQTCLDITMRRRIHVSYDEEDTCKRYTCSANMSRHYMTHTQWADRSEQRKLTHEKVST